METLEEKVASSVEVIRKGARLAEMLNPDEGYVVGFSGGKDSLVLLDLVKKAGVKYTAHYSVTSIDPPENVYYIRNNFPEVKFIHHKRNFFRLVERKGLPTIWHRFCCEELKEGIGVGSVCLVGVRAEESVRRATYAQLEVRSRRKEHKNTRGRLTLEAIYENEHRCIKGKDKVMLYPILAWTAADVWEYIRREGLVVNPLYRSHKRVGCMFCPYARRIEVLEWCRLFPKFKELLVSSLQKYLDKREWDDVKGIKTAHDYFEWWLSGEKLSVYLAKKKQGRLFDVEE